MNAKRKNKLDRLFKEGGINNITYQTAIFQLEELLDEKIKEKEKENYDVLIEKIQFVINETFPNGYELAS